jgi:poly-gamma-glutamate system protein
MSRSRIFPALHLALVIVCSGAFAQQRIPHPEYERMLKAAQLEQRCSREIFLTKHRLNLLNAYDDVNRTGLIGEELTDLTTTIGVVEAKRTAATPDFAAYLVRLLAERGLGKNDTALVTMTGSFPGLNLALLCALETLGIHSLRVASLGSSSFGANQPDMTWIDMEDILFREGLLEQRSDYVTLGGSGDIGGGLNSGVIKKLRRKCARLGYTLIESGNLREQFEERKRLLGMPERFDLLVNVGGNHLMLGIGPEGRELPGGWIDPKSGDWSKTVSSSKGGIVFDFLFAGVPVLNLLHVDEIAEQGGVPIDPRPLPRLGASDVYFVTGTK